MSTDNRTMINDCDANTGWTGDDSSTVANNTGEFYEGSASLSSQFSDTEEQMHTTQDSVGGTTFTLDWSDSTLYMLVKDNLSEPFSGAGMQLVIGDGTDLIGYHVGGNDAVGAPGFGAFYHCYKLDVAVQVASPGANTAHSGSEANLDQTVCTQVGLATHHLAKANGPSDNCFYDAFRYIANDSYALTIDGGTSGTPETMVDVTADDVTNGWGMCSNPVASQYYFIAPTEWGESASSADHYFTADDEQWYWLGDNGGGHAVGTGHFPMRLISNGADTGSWVVNGTVIVNTGTGADFDMSNTDFDIIEMDGCQLSGLASLSAPSSGGTSRFLTNTVISQCGTVTHNGASMNGCSILDSLALANGDAVFYDEASDPDGEMDDMTFEQGTNAHHAMTFGANIPTEITIRGADFTGFSSSDDNDGSVFQFEDTSGTITLNLIDCTTDGSGFTVDSRAGCTVDVVISPVVTKVTIQNSAGDLLEDARVFLETADDGPGGHAFEEAVTTLTQSSGTATLTASAVHGLATNDYVVIRGANNEGYNRQAQITVTSTTVFTYTVPSGEPSPAGGTPVFSYCPISGDTDVNGEIQSSKTWPAAQGLTGWGRRSAGLYKQTAINIPDASGGTDLLVTLQSDE